MMKSMLSNYRLFGSGTLMQLRAFPNVGLYARSAEQAPALEMYALRE